MFLIFNRSTGYMAYISNPIPIISNSGVGNHINDNDMEWLRKMKDGEYCHIANFTIVKSAGGVEVKDLAKR